MWCPCCLPQDPANMYCVRILQGNRGCLDFGETFVSAQWNLEGFLYPLKWPSAHIGCTSLKCSPQKFWTKLSHLTWNLQNEPMESGRSSLPPKVAICTHRMYQPEMQSTKILNKTFAPHMESAKWAIAAKKVSSGTLKNNSTHRMLNWIERDVTWNNFTSLSLACLNLLKVTQLNFTLTYLNSISL